MKHLFHDDCLHPGLEAAVAGLVWREPRGQIMPGRSCPQNPQDGVHHFAAEASSAVRTARRLWDQRGQQPPLVVGQLFGTAMRRFWLLQRLLGHEVSVPQLFMRYTLSRAGHRAVTEQVPEIQWGTILKLPVPAPRLCVHLSRRIHHGVLRCHGLAVGPVAEPICQQDKVERSQQVRRHRPDLMNAPGVHNQRLGTCHPRSGASRCSRCRLIHRPRRQ